MNSFGPWALECGPKTPVMTNCAAGNILPSMPMKGILPPSPSPMGGFSKVVDAFSSDACSHGAVAGAFHPPIPMLPTISILAGTLTDSITDRIAWRAASASTAGGRRKEKVIVVKGRRTFPARLVGGIPSTPVKLTDGFHVRFRILSTLSSPRGFTPSTKGNSSQISSPTTDARALACSTRSSGMSQSSGIRIFPLSG
eukprot:12277_1